MIGLGETKAELVELMDDLRCVHVDFLTIGQYLQPSKDHVPVQKYYTPEEFESLKQIALEKGFKHVESGPLVRSSYRAERFF
jgi:lipoic acid synthetase